MNRINELATELRLNGIKESIDYRVSEASEGGLSHQDFLHLLLEDEMLYRKNKRSIRLKARAKFNHLATLDEFECSKERNITKTTIKLFSSLGFIENKENIVLFGSTGVGKSYLAQAIGHASCLNGISVLYFSVNKFLKEVEAQEAAGSYLKFLNRVKKTEVLILDDFGLRNYTHKEANVLYDVMEDRFRQTSTIVTSQVKPLGWKSLFEDQVIAEAIVDRITSCARKIELKGENFRTNFLPKN